MKKIRKSNTEIRIVSIISDFEFRLSDLPDLTSNET